MAEPHLDPQVLNKILSLPMGENDAKAKTVREYLGKLLLGVWQDGESFSGKRPFGNSNWEHDLYTPLVKAGVVEGKFEDGSDYAPDMTIDEQVKADRLIVSSIKMMFNL